MNQAIEDSKKFDIVCISFGKEKERRIEVQAKGQKDSFLTDTMQINAIDCKAEDILSKEQIETLKENREARKTEKAIEKTNTIGR